MSDFKKRNIIIGALCGVLLLMIVGYAAFQSVLNINGTTTISSNWNVLITNIEEKNKVGDATSVEGYPTHDTLTATFQTNLVSPGDSITYDVTIENKGTIDAELANIKVNKLDNPAITFETSGISEGDILEASGSAVLTVKVTYNNEVTSQPKNTGSKIIVTLDYVQKGKSEEYTPNNKVDIGGNKVELVTNGDGLYEDIIELGRYVYAGADPNNYITFNGEAAGWRIVAIETDGTIKIMRNPARDALTTKIAFDSAGNRTTGYCNETYAIQNGCNVWAKTNSYTSANGQFSGIVDKDSEIKEYLNGTYYTDILTEDAKKYIEKHNFYYGSVDYPSTNLAIMVQQEKGNSAISNVGLIQGSDYIKSNTNITLCGTNKLVYDNSSTCSKTTYMFKDIKTGYYTITADGRGASGVLMVNLGGNLGISSAFRDTVSAVPTVYLKSDITLSGSGTKEEPYNIIN